MAIKTLRSTHGQFIPISAMIMFTVVIFLMAVVNVYTVTKAKLQIQNLADAAALNLASQQAQAFNLVADKNEWLNHMMEGVPSPHDGNAPEHFKDCSVFQGVPGQPKYLPGISCVENRGRMGKTSDLMRERPPNAVFLRHIFASRDGAINYGMILYTVNQSQKLFIQAYNSFLGANAGGAQNAAAAPRNFTALLKKDIPKLADPSIRLMAWNSQSGESSVESTLRQWKDDKDVVNEEADLKSQMDPMNFRIDHELEMRYFVKRGDDKTYEVSGGTFGSVIFSCVTRDAGDSDYGKCGPLEGQPYEPIGWLVPANMPQMKVNDQTRSGVGVLVEKRVKLPVVGSISVTAQSKAYIVESGANAFRSTYWVKLGR